MAVDDFRENVGHVGHRIDAIELACLDERSDRLLKSEGRQLHFVLAGVPDPGNPAAIAEETLLGWQCREVVTHGVNGLLVPVRDGKALAKAIAQLHDDAALARRLGEAAREKALAEFDDRVVIKQTLDVYYEIAS